jgi:HAD superfamily hydrolase (TIGR01549 family)
MRHALRIVLDELRRLDPESAEALDIEKMISIRKAVAEKFRGRVMNLEAIRLEAFRETLVGVGRPNEPLAEHLNQVYLKHRFEDIELFDDVLPTLGKLKEKYILGLVSNGNSYPQRCGLDNMFRFVVFSQDWGVKKPDPRIFQIALREAGCSKEELLHVGDSYEDDVQGALNAGVRCIWLNWHGAKTSPSKKIRQISSLSELCSLLST